MNAHGTAHELPAGRLASFEDDDDADYASILGTRPRSAAAPAAAEPAAPAAEQPAAPAVAEPAAPKAPARKRKTAKKSEPTPTPEAAATEPEVVEETTTAAGGDSTEPAANKIRSSSIHIPTDLLERLVPYRDTHGLSNGQVVIEAIEFSYSKLKELIHPAAAGGGLFAQRATKGTRINEGPLTPLNVRLYEADYDVIDNIVKEVGAFSRGHLVTVSLRYFFDNQQ